MIFAIWEKIAMSQPRYNVKMPLITQRDGELGDALGDDDGHGEVLRVGGDVAQHHDSGKTNVAFALANVVDDGSHTASVHHQLGQLGRVLDDFSVRGTMPEMGCVSDRRI